MKVDVWVIRAGAAAARAARDRIASAHPGSTTSFADSGGLAVVAVANGPVGVDLERVRSRPRMEAVARRVLGEAEARRIAQAAGRDRNAVFHRAWTAAEASAKARGEGLPALLGGRGGDRLPVAWFEPAPGFVAAVATEGAAPAVRVHHEP